MRKKEIVAALDEWIAEQLDEVRKAFADGDVRPWGRARRLWHLAERTGRLSRFHDLAFIWAWEGVGTALYAERSGMQSREATADQIRLCLDVAERGW